MIQPTGKEEDKFFNSVFVQAYKTGKNEYICPVCNGKVTIEFFSKYKDPYVIKCETENYLKLTCRGL